MITPAHARCAGASRANCSGKLSAEAYERMYEHKRATDEWDNHALVLIGLVLFMFVVLILRRFL